MGLSPYVVSRCGWSQVNVRTNHVVLPHWPTTVHSYCGGCERTVSNR